MMKVKDILTLTTTRKIHRNLDKVLESSIRDHATFLDVKGNLETLSKLVTANLGRSCELPTVISARQ